MEHKILSMALDEAPEEVERLLDEAAAEGFRVLQITASASNLHVLMARRRR